MTTMTTETYPLLVSELPPVPAGVPSRRATRRGIRQLERALRGASGQERTDLVAQERAQRTVTRTVT